jgi:predicted RNA methylase
VFVPTPQDVVNRMLELAEVTDHDLVVDLGSGDGRVVLTAARKHGSRAVGYELDAVLVRRSLQAVQEQSLERLVRIEERDLFTADLTQADVVVVFLPGSLLQRLGPQLAQLKRGARVLSHEFIIPGVPPDKTVRMISNEDQAEHTIHLWKGPLRFQQP